MVDLKCNWCGKPFSKRNSYVKEHNFCCRDCYHKWQSETLVGEDNKHYKRLDIPCTYCGNILKIKPSLLKIQKKFLLR